ncbi:MAG: polysaccharide biosynthesis/export family protein [Pedobacter sp.]
MRYAHLLIILYGLICLSSCGGIKNYKYFKDISDSSAVTDLTTAIYVEPRIQPDDIMYIAIQTIEPSAGSTINALNAQSGSSALLTGGGTSSSGPSQGTTYGFLVDKQGEVAVPILGSVKLSGLTTQEARIVLTEKASKYYKDATIIVRFANFKITVLGEVMRPGSYSVPNERVSLLDALGYAGDLTIFGKRDNILLLRRNANGKTQAARLDLTKSNIFQSPYFYLQQNDQIYIEPNKSKVTSSDGTLIRNISIGSAVLGFLVVIISRF